MLYVEQGWSSILSLIIQTYLNGSTICILWHEAYDFRPEIFAPDYASFVAISRSNLAGSFEHNVIDASDKIRQLNANNLTFDELQLKIALSIEATHCESYMVFGSDIPYFVAAFTQAVMYSIWRSLHNKFVFVHEPHELKLCCTDYFFQDQPNILFVVRSTSNFSTFELKTNKFVGPRAEHPEHLRLLDRYDAQSRVFQYGNPLFFDKLSDLMGRELIIAYLNYKPYTVIKNDTISNSIDVGNQGTKVYIDGTETQIVMTFCEKFNCTLQADTSDADDWGTIYPNITGDGALGMILDHKADVCIGAMYSWYDAYVYVDMSMYLVRSGITCLVPAPKRLTSWYLPLQPFQGTLWAAVIFCLCMEIISLSLTYKADQLMYAKHHLSWISGVKYALAITFKLFISQSGNVNASSATVRVLLFACFLNDIIISSIYGGGLASILTIPSLGEAADTVQRLRDHKLSWAANSEAWVAAIRGSDDQLVQDLLSQFHIYNDDELYQLALQGRMGFTVERLPFGHFAIGDYLTSQAIQQMKIMQDDIDFQFTVAFVPRIWPLLENFNALVYRWHSSGFDKYWEYRIVAENMNEQTQQQVESSISQNPKDIGPVMLGMSNFAGILLVWVLGVTVAFVVFIFEWFSLKCVQH